MTTFRILREVEPPSSPFGRRRRGTRVPRSYARALALSLCGVLLAGLAPEARAQTTSCYASEAPEESGPTDINAVSGNRRLTAAFNDEGTMTVLKWPSPSFYDQLDYRTTDRSEPRMGARANDGSFLGLAWRSGGDSKKWHFSWLRDWRSTQRFSSANADEVTTKHFDRDVGLTVRVRDVVAADRDALVRDVQVTRTRRSPARAIRVFSFANFNPVFSKTAGAPEDDWCTDDSSDDGAAYLKGSDAVLHASAGVDESTGQSSSVAMVMAFAGSSEGHSIGTDPGGSAYDDSTDAVLSNNGSTSTRSDAAVFDGLSLGKRRKAATQVIFAAGRTREKALDTLRSARAQGAQRLRQKKVAWWRTWLKRSPLPAGAPKPVVRLAKRSLISLRQAIDPDGLIVTSVATQSPLALEWVRNSAYMNAALLKARHAYEVKKHNLALIRYQAKVGSSTIPSGNWPTAMYADGVSASRTPYEIDSTGLGIWTLWDTYAETRDVNYLSAVYDPIRRAADHLTDTCINPTDDLQCLAHEEDSTGLRRTIVGAQAAWLGLRSAVSAAKEAMKVFSHSAAKRNAWSERRDELRQAIIQSLYDEDCKCYTRNPSVGGTLLWPVRLFAPGTKASNRQADLNWRAIARRMNGDVKAGGMEARALLGNAYAWSGRDRKEKNLKRALLWMSKTRVTDGTGLLGGAWKKSDGRVVIMRSQPHAWHHAMYYLAALKTYGEKPYSF